LWSLARFPMTISQPSPDRLVFQPKYKSIISFQILYGILTICSLSIAGAFVVEIGLLFSFVLSKSLAASYLNISNDTQRVTTIILICIFTAVYSAFNLYLARLLLSHHITDSCTFDRTASSSDSLYFGDVLIQQRNIFDRKRTIKIPLHKILDIQVQRVSWLYLSGFDIVLNTTLSAKPTYISKIAQNVKPFATLKSILAKGGIVPSLIKEIELIREFLYLPPKPSYLVDENSDCMVPDFMHFYKSKILKETSNNFTYYRLCILLWYAETYDFNSIAGIVTIEYRYFGMKFVRRIAMDTIQSIVLKRELITPMDSIGEIFNLPAKERYSAILVPTESNFKREKSDRAFYIPGNLSNGYKRLYTSNNLLEVKDFADRLNHYLAVADRESSLQPIY
jgi:hypothetical protein